MGLTNQFQTADEEAISKEFLEKGYIIGDAVSRNSLHDLRHELVKEACKYLELKLPENDHQFLDTIHSTLSVDRLNAFRLHIYNALNATDWLRPTYYQIGKTYIDLLAGNELAMQNKVNFSIQLPQDESSLIGIHADSYTGETPFQVVQWIPLVDVSGTKSMYILSPEKNRIHTPRLKQLAQGGSDQLFESVKKDCTWLDLKFGQILIFCPNILHGNIVNTTPESRWSMNCRFTGLFTPYTSRERKLGDFYLPITTKPVSRIGMKFKIPEGFEET